MRKTEKASPVGSVDRALRIIELLSENPRGMTLDEVAAAAEAPHSSMHRLLSALKHRGFAAQPEPSGRYFLGPSLLAAAFRFYEAIDIRLLIHPELVRVHAAFNETVHLGLLSEAQIVYIDKIEAVHPVKLSSVIGGRNPAHCTGLGKALLAFVLTDDDAVRAWVARHGPLERRTENTITDTDALCAELAAIRERGYSQDLGENELEVNCVGVPIFLGSSTPAAALSLSAPRQRMGTEDLEKAAAVLLEAQAAVVAPQA